MADCDDTIHNAFKTVFKSIKHSLYCAWHVLRAWQKNAAGLGGDRAKIMKELSSLLYTQTTPLQVSLFLTMLTFSGWCVVSNGSGRFSTQMGSA